LNTYSQALPSDLPPLFLDAILITKRLKQRYLWIDSLCIIQDSNDDWQREAANMGNIYKNSVFTIAASHIFKDSASLLNGSRHLGEFVEFHTHSEEHHLSGRLFAQSKNYQIERPEWLSRAWTLQEELLSPRLLNWGRRMLSWKCRTLVASENYPLHSNRPDYLTLLQEEGSNNMLNRICLPSSELQNLKDQPNVLALWRRILADFNQRSITKDNDRLPAISGIAKEVARHTGYHYKAGLWSENIHEELFWHSTRDPRYRGTKPTSYVAPSWSWASLNFSPIGIEVPFWRIFHIGHEIKPIAEILNFSVTNTGPDAYGQVSSASLEVRSKYREISEVVDEGTRLILDYTPQTIPREQRHHWDLQEVEDSDKYYQDSVSSIPPTAGFLQILRVHGEPSSHTWCLVVIPVAGTRRTFQRIGVASFVTWGETKGWVTKRVTLI